MGRVTTRGTTAQGLVSCEAEMPGSRSLTSLPPHAYIDKGSPHVHSESHPEARWLARGQRWRSVGMNSRPTLMDASPWPMIWNRSPGDCAAQRQAENFWRRRGPGGMCIAVAPNANTRDWEPHYDPAAFRIGNARSPSTGQHCNLSVE